MAVPEKSEFTMAPRRSTAQQQQADAAQSDSVHEDADLDPPEKRRRVSERRAVQNRNAQRAFRERREQHLRNLEQVVALHGQEMSSVRAEAAALAEQLRAALETIETLRSENKRLSEELAAHSTQPSAAVSATIPSSAIPSAAVSNLPEAALPATVATCAQVCSSGYVKGPSTTAIPMRPPSCSPSVANNYNHGSNNHPHSLPHPLPRHYVPEPPSAHAHHAQNAHPTPGSSPIVKSSTLSLYPCPSAAAVRGGRVGSMPSQMLPHPFAARNNPKMRAMPPALIPLKSPIMASFGSRRHSSPLASIAASAVPPSSRQNFNAVALGRPSTQPSCHALVPIPVKAVASTPTPPPIQEPSITMIAVNNMSIAESPSVFLNTDLAADDAPNLVTAAITEHKNTHLSHQHPSNLYNDTASNYHAGLHMKYITQSDAYPDEDVHTPSQLDVLARAVMTSVDTKIDPEMSINTSQPSHMSSSSSLSLTHLSLPPTLPVWTPSPTS